MVFLETYLEILVKLPFGNQPNGSEIAADQNR